MMVMWGYVCSERRRTRYGAGARLRSWTNSHRCVPSFPTTFFTLTMPSLYYTIIITNISCHSLELSLRRRTLPRTLLHSPNATPPYLTTRTTLPTRCPTYAHLTQHSPSNSNTPVPNGSKLSLRRSRLSGREATRLRWLHRRLNGRYLDCCILGDALGYLDALGRLGRTAMEQGTRLERLDAHKRCSFVDLLRMKLRQAKVSVQVFRAGRIRYP
ncbi:hypothetical protein BC629DRAFT_560447 [Irpex lacteus]|nr:hypothetical protein BC629DRAFT_560447 [Irpex lacteus]